MTNQSDTINMTIKDDMAKMEAKVATKNDVATKSDLTQLATAMIAMKNRRR